MKVERRDDQFSKDAEYKRLLDRIENDKLLSPIERAACRKLLAAIMRDESCNDLLHIGLSSKGFSVSDIWRSFLSRQFIPARKKDDDNEDMPMYW